jgi:hypothetical protein
MNIKARIKKDDYQFITMIRDATVTVTLARASRLDPRT